MPRSHRIAAVMIALLGATCAAKATESVRVTYASFDALYAPYFIGIEKGYFKQQGLDVELVQAGGGTAIPAVIAGSVQFTSSSGSAISAILRGAKLKVVMTQAVSLPWKLWATNPDIKTLRDLKDKPVGVETAGGLDDLALRAALMKAGLPQNWVAYTPVGVGGMQRVAIIQHASLPAIFLSYIEERMARQSGALKNGHVLVDFPKELQMPYNGLATSSDLIAKDPEMVRHFLEGVEMGVRYMRTHRDGTLRILTKYAGKAAPDVLAESLDVTIPTVLTSGEASADVRQFDLRVRGSILNIADGDLPPIDKVYDYSFVARAIADIDERHWQPAE
jgi:NitT/TauT family transport system substrate-binding protein